MKGINQRSREYSMIIINGKKILEHRYIFEKHNGKIPKELCIHHINGNRKDNRIENLQCVTRKEHGKLHWKPNRIRIKYPSGSIKVIKITLS